MNKDLDERLIPAGEYRDAMNIEVSTSEGSNVGTVQTTKGNTVLTSKLPSGSTCVGSIADYKNNKIYWLVAGPVGGDKVSAYINKDYILEYDIATEKCRYVVVDIWEVKADMSEDGHTSASSDYDHFHIADLDNADINITGVRLDMLIVGEFTKPGTSTTQTITESDNLTVTRIESDSYGTDWRVYHSAPGDGTGTGVFPNGVYSKSTDTIKFKSKKRLLNFDKDRLITGINIIDGMLFWTDDYSEPKKINIERSIKGTGGTEYLYTGLTWNSGSQHANHSNNGWQDINTNLTHITFNGGTDHFHTRLVSSTDGINLETMTNPEGNKAIWL